jgi:hypothetical protein
MEQMQSGDTESEETSLEVVRAATSREMSQEQEIAARFCYLEGRFFKFKKITKVCGDGSFNISFICLQCPLTSKAIMASTKATSNLRRHVNSVHSRTLKDFESVQLLAPGGSRKRRGEELQVPANQLKIEGFAKSGTTSTFVSQDQVNKKVVNFILKEAMPFTLVKSESFKELVLLGLPGKKVISYPTLMSRISEEYELWRKELKEELSNVDCAAITCDCWTVGSCSYLGMTCHWLSDDLSRKSVALACRRIVGSHTFDVLAEKIESIQKEFGIHNKTVGATTDSGSNFVKAFRLFEVEVTESQRVSDAFTESQSDAGEEGESSAEEDEIAPVDVAEILDDQEQDDLLYHLPKHYRCASHTMNLIATKDVEKANSDKSFKKVSRSALGKCQELWNKQKRSSLSADKIREAIGGLFVVPNATRWNALFMALQRVEDVIAASSDGLDSLMDSLGLPRFAGGDVHFITEYCRVMKPFAQGLDILQGENNCYMGVLLPVLATVKKKLVSLTSSLKICKPLTTALLAGIEKRFGESFTQSRLIVAAAIHPRFKVSWLSGEEEKFAAFAMVLAELEKLDAVEETRIPFQEQASNDFDLFFPGDQEEAQDSNLEILEVLKSRSVNKVVHLTEHPKLCTLFRKFNTVLPSSAAVERLFSYGGGIFRKNRFMLKDESFEMQLMLKVNK